ncbi:hypothetical protein TGRH88_030410 [Toxoplasma gondii]|uniref:Uncharacterized protein n=1 Tax=Toxoplasma gondii TaxID=5811 RepID=A0A7J6K7D4_TOXGO|nr:hypothetical protein TGRH88_030410 [Toxoplasma gondii]
MTNSQTAAGWLITVPAVAKGVCSFQGVAEVLSLRERLRLENVAVSVSQHKYEEAAKRLLLRLSSADLVSSLRILEFFVLPSACSGGFRGVCLLIFHLRWPFPHPSFSSAGTREGTLDKKTRLYKQQEDVTWPTSALSRFSQQVFC